MAKRTVLLPLCGVRNIFTVVPVPKSKIRRHALVVSSLTQAAIVKLVSPLTTPAGMVTWSSVPSRLTACPACPVTNVGPLTSVPFLPLPLLSFAFPSKVYWTIGPVEGVGVTEGVGVGPTPPSPDGTLILVVSARGCPRLGVLSAFQLNFWMRVVRSVRPQSPFGLFTP